MLIEAITQTCRVKYDGHTVVLRPSHPVDLPEWVIAELQALPHASGQWRVYGSCHLCGSRVFYTDTDSLKCAYCRPPSTTAVQWFVVST